MGRHCELRSSYLLKVCRSYGAWGIIALKWIIGMEYTNYLEIDAEFPNVSQMRALL